MASKLGVTALYVTPYSGKWGSFDPRTTQDRRHCIRLFRVARSFMAIMWNCEIWHRRTLPEKDRASAISSMLRTFGNIRPSGSSVCVQTDRHTTLVTMLRFLHRCNKRLQRLPKILINAFVIFVKVYYFNKRRMKCREKLCRIVRVKRSIRREAKQTDSDVEIFRKVNN